VPWRRGHERHRTVGRGMGNDGASGEPMAFDGGAATRRMRVRRMAPARPQRYYAQEPLGTADRPGVGGLPRRACTAQYGGRPTGCARRHARGVLAHSGAKHFSLALFNCILLQFFQQKWAQWRISKL
jgi:hypothetical protein